MNRSFPALFAAAALAAAPVCARAQPAPTALPAPAPVPTVAPADPLATYAWLPGPAVTGPNGRLGFVDQSLALAAPVWADDRHSLTASAGVRSDLLQGQPAAGGGGPLSAQVWDVRLGLTGARCFDGGWSAGGGLKVGSAGDRPFDGPGKLDAAVNAFLRLPSGQRDSWTLSVSYAPLAPAPLPTPSVSYSWAPSEWLSADVGVPFPLVYTPARPGGAPERIDLGTGPLLTGQVRFRW